MRTEFLILLLVLTIPSISAMDSENYEMDSVVENTMRSTESYYSLKGYLGPSGIFESSDYCIIGNIAYYSNTYPTTTTAIPPTPSPSPSPPPAPTPGVAVISVAGSPLRMVEDQTSNVSLQLENVEDFGTATIELHYDSSVVEVEDVTNGNITGSTMFYTIDNPNGTTGILVYTNQIPGPEGDFEFANITLEAVGDGGDETSLNISVLEFADSEGDSMPVTVYNGSLSIGRLGDVSGDGQVSGVDAMYIAQYIVGIREELPNSSAADVNCDGEITGVDAMYIAQHVLGLRELGC